jgi:hypothetical protein
MELSALRLLLAVADAILGLQTRQVLVKRRRED